MNRLQAVAARETDRRDTVVPCAYPELESETYRSLDFVTERRTDVPPPSDQLGLELDCWAE